MAREREQQNKNGRRLSSASLRTLRESTSSKPAIARLRATCEECLRFAASHRPTIRCLPHNPNFKHHQSVLILIFLEQQ